MANPWKKALFKALSGLTINLSSGWFGAILILPNFSPIKTWADFWVLIYNVVFGSIFLGISILIEKDQIQ